MREEKVIRLLDFARGRGFGVHVEMTNGDERAGDIRNIGERAFSIQGGSRRTVIRFAQVAWIGLDV